MNAEFWESVWYWIWQTIWVNSISTLVLLPVVLVLCRIFERRPAVQNLLWLLLLVKFMTPHMPGFAWVIPDATVGAGWSQTLTLPPSPPQPVSVFAGKDFTSKQSSDPRSLPSHDPETRDHEPFVAAPVFLPQPVPVIEPFPILGTVLLGIWILGTSYFVISIGIGLRNQRRILRRTTSATRGLSDAVTKVANRLGLRKLMSVLSADVHAPFVSCLGTVRLVWPQSLATSEPSTLKSLIAHEVAHVRRRDHLVAWLELIATLVWWWNPVFWFVRRRLRASAEMACDAIAVEAFPDDRCLYAEKLLELSARFHGGTRPLALAVGGDAPSSLERRLTMIVSERSCAKTTLVGLLVVCLLAVAAIPSWISAQSAESLPAPEPISWVLDPFLGVTPPPPQPISNQETTGAASSLNNQEKLILRLKAMYLVALSENRTTDADALAAAITAMTQVKATEAQPTEANALESGGAPNRFESGALPGGPGAVPGGSGIGGPAGGGSGVGLGSAGNSSSSVTDELPEILNAIGAMRSDTILSGIELWNIENGTFDSHQNIVISDHTAVRIKITGNNFGMVWGNNPYTDDSSLNAAAIHAGLVGPGETADVVLIRRPGKELYTGSTSHGIPAADYGPWPGSFELAPVSQYPDAPYLSDRRALRGNNDAYLSLNMLAGQAPLKPGVSLIVPLYGRAGAPIVGTDQYASDCNLDAAAVHAGVIGLGELGFAKIILAEGLENYTGSTRNGVESYPYGKTNMSLRFEKLPTTQVDGMVLPTADSQPNPNSIPPATGSAPLDSATPPGASSTPSGMGGVPVLRDISLLGELFQNSKTEPSEAPTQGGMPPSQQQAVPTGSPNLALPNGNEPPAELVEPKGEMSGGGMPSGGAPSPSGELNAQLDFAAEQQLVPIDRRAYLVRDLGPRRNWHIERFNLPTAFSFGQLRPYQNLVVRVKVSGVNDGSVWGSNAYTDDSSINAAALHAGLVQPGQTTEIVAIIRPGMESYGGSSFHGVTSNDFGPYPGSFQLAPLSQHPDAPYLCDRSTLQGNADAYLSLNKLAGQANLKPGVSLIVPLHAKAGAPIVGTDQYASDCNLDAAAVHAGVLRSGESGYVKIILAEGLEQYEGSTQNGIESYPYGKTKMSLRFEKLSTTASASSPSDLFGTAPTQGPAVVTDIDVSYSAPEIRQAIEAMTIRKPIDTNLQPPAMNSKEGRLPDLIQPVPSTGKESDGSEPSLVDLERNE